MEFTRAAQGGDPFPLLHNDITELLDIRHMVLLYLLLEDAPWVFNKVQVWRYTWPLIHLLYTSARQLSSWRCVWGRYHAIQPSF